MHKYNPNPSNSRMFEVENKIPHPLPPSRWYLIPDKSSLQESIEKTMNAACINRARINQMDSSNCPFPYLLSSNPESSVDVFLKAIATMDKVEIKTLNVFSPDGLQGKEGNG